MLPFPKVEFIQSAKEIHRALNHGDLGTFSGLLDFAHEYPSVMNAKGNVELAKTQSIEDAKPFLRGMFTDYYAARDETVTLVEVATVADPALDVVLQAFKGVKQEACASISEWHRVSMAAEDSVGALLERYLAEKLEPLGWLWCCGHIVIGVDFFHAGNPPTLLQVKNRSNSENSSSAKIRELVRQLGCPAPIKKWHRTNAYSANTRWDKFTCETRLRGIATEVGFREFIRDYPAKVTATSAAQ